MSKIQPESVEVTQADREAAAEQYLHIQELVEHPLSPQEQKRTADQIRDGRWDKDEASVQAFARHRIASTTPADATAVEAEREWQPIETFAEPTALSSGCGVLVADEDGTVGEAYFRNFDDSDNGWWWANTSWGDYPEPTRPAPTHWMPLPMPPRTPREG